MPYTVFLSLGISAVLLILSLLFRLAGKFRLTLPLLYFLLTATVLNPWAAAHETLAFAILFCLLALSVISWLFSLRNALRDRKYYKALEEDMSWQINRARRNGISMDSVYFDSAGNQRNRRLRHGIPCLFCSYNSIISRTTRSAIFTAPTSTSMLKISSAI